MAQTPIPFGFGGGLDLVSPALAVPAGRVISSMNYEPLAEGYGRAEGFERFDGRKLASDTAFWALPIESGSIPPAVGAWVLGGTSGANGRMILEPIASGGSWGDNTFAGTIVLLNVVGDFEPGETLVSGGLPFGVAAGEALEDEAPDDIARAHWQDEATHWQRSSILPVPGAGPVRGVTEINGVVYAWRDNSAGTMAALYKSTATGWVAVPASQIVQFANGLTEFDQGAVITGGTSGSSAEAHRVVRQTGDWGKDAAGFVVFGPDAPAFTANEQLRVDGVMVAIAGVTDRTGFAPGGRFMTIKHNFYGSSNRSCVYGANGTGNGFEFDGLTVTPIETQMDDDRPTHVFEIANHLGFAFRGGSVQFSSIGEPLLWDVIQGAGEIGLGTDITDVIQANESAVVLFGQQKIATMSGRDAESFQLDELTEEAGADPWTAQRVGQTIYLDRRGLRSLTATSAFGNFKAGTLVDIIEPYFRTKRKAKAVPVLSLVCRSKSQYRLFWSDGTGLTVYMGGKDPQAMPFELNGVQVSCGITCELDDGTEGMFVGAEDGYVYRLDSGPSFDGDGVRAFIMTPFNTFGAPMMEKRLHKITLELQAEPSTKIGVTAQFNYGDGHNPISGRAAFMVAGAGLGNDFVVTGGGGNWDMATWNQFFWSAPIEGQAEIPIDGMGRNVSFIIAAVSDRTERAHILQAAIVHQSARKRVR